MKEELKAPLATLCKAVISALVVFCSTVIGQLFGSDGSTLALLGASIGTAINFS